MAIKTAIDGFKTREEELKELLAPDGVLNKEIFDALQGVVEAERNPDSEFSETSSKAYEAFDNALNRYLKYAIEYDRLKR